MTTETATTAVEAMAEATAAQVTAATAIEVDMVTGTAIGTAATAAVTSMAAGIGTVDLVIATGSTIEVGQVGTVGLRRTPVVRK